MFIIRTAPSPALQYLARMKKCGLSQMISCLILAFFFLSGSNGSDVQNICTVTSRPDEVRIMILKRPSAQSARITFTNNCPNTIWPGTLTADQKPQLSTTGFELASKASTSLDAQAPWKGRFWARTGCSTDASGRFSCATADCASGQVACNGNGAVPPASLVEINIVENGGQDFYDVSLVDGFNLPVSVSTEGGSGECKTSSCPANVNAVCPAELQLKAADGSVVACKSACTAFNQPQYCCTGDFNTPQTCPPTNYSMIFENKCPQAYSYAYDDVNSTFTCSGAPNYVITFCP
ncbi:thaumatin-like protein 1b isoform X3 [Juglans microcarpa x Juglans regia]|uniref:thaumatin-like protein 1b isoform X3 n=1 Tax=Juglans microcarpa x Juglans regia TaxID=2249226 RepID=UPI001B7F4E46|nr:thaumatin-like protein 1b isoform X3 [Juglans microcarpa x Juglans regia]